MVCLALTDCRKADIEVYPEELTVGNDMETVTFQVTANTSWSITCANSWVTVAPSSGSGSAEVVLTVLANSSGKTRETEVYVTAGKAENANTAVLRVVQPALSLYFSTDLVEIPKEGGACEFTVHTDGPWNVIPTDTCIVSVSPTSGVGTGSVEVVCSPNMLRKNKDAALLFKSGAMISRLPVRIAPQENHGPDIPTLLYPIADEQNVGLLPDFSWRCVDIDGDPLTYTLRLSEDNISWSEYQTDETSYSLAEPLTSMSRYHWQIVADDGNGRDNSVSVSDIRSFTTSAKTHYEDGEAFLIHQADASVSHPVNLVFMGDGYVEDDYRVGGTFVSDMREGVKALFSVEPYITYEKYFNVYAVAAWSAERGMSITGVQTRDTKFKVTKTAEDRTALECDWDMAFQYALCVPGIAEGDLGKTPIFLMSNQNVYAGTCGIYEGGESISIIPVSRPKDLTFNTDYASILLHEGGGHGIGLLADEYVTYKGEALPEYSEDGWSVLAVKAWHLLGALTNISISSEDESIIPWADLMGRTEYSAITNPQGGLYYEFGVWRSEVNSCMIDNRHYFSAAQRLAIVKRIKSAAGETFVLDDFIANDKTDSSEQTKASVPDGFTPLAPPRMMGRR